MMDEKKSQLSAETKKFSAECPFFPPSGPLCYPLKTFKYIFLAPQVQMITLLLLLLLVVVFHL
jgi:hypothetical protein